ncbi:MAG: fasciclin domain-containing protein [Brevundimonas sp.]|uniref:fasciclin domain-containing protein n=1 Tax=Brevundimonas sp. Leaf363 TaxID=1736353 RepID=UPI0006FF2917|nr:fasciclin domain-containing protein [Brevundimonas sp. Leaf363]KQS53896.1 hypothetical protein ASG17_13125 [Brevundimonas sp. Leaf363]RZJ97305.1 MAG: fasciclin domain-containing protein [Brevundimonas sp.]
MNTLQRRAAMSLVLLSLTAAPLAACGEKAETTGPAGTPAPSSKTLAEALKGEGDLNALEGVVGGSGLATVLDGKGPYTVFAPVDAAMQATGGANDLSDEALRAQSIALLRAHTVPGALTRADINGALDRASGGSVEMRTMADGLLKFTRDGQTIVVTAPDGAVGRLTGAETLASNGVLQPVDGVLVKPAA